MRTWNEAIKLAFAQMLALESLGQSASAYDAEEGRKTAKRGTHINATFVPLRAQAENREPAEINTADFQAKNIRWLAERFVARRVRSRARADRGGVLILHGAGRAADSTLRTEP